MHILHVHARVKPEYVEAFREATIENATNSLKEPGVVRFDVIQRQDDPAEFALVEVYHNAEGHAQHRETAHYHAWIARVEQMFAEPRTRALYNNVFPEDAGW